MSQGKAHVPPQSLEAEQATLGAMLLERAAIETACEFLRPDSFYREAHKVIFAAECDLAARHEPVDLTTLAAELERRGQLEQAGGRPYLATLLDAVPTAAHVEYYGRIVWGKAILRALIGAADGIKEACYGEVESVEAVTGQALADVRRIAESASTGRALITHKEAMMTQDDYYEAADEHPREITGMRMGLPCLDARTDGMQASEMTVVTARKGGGKTVLAMQTAIHVAEAGVKVQYHTLEMSVPALVNRAVAARARINSLDLRRGGLSCEEIDRRTHAQASLWDLPITYDPTTGITPGHILATARREKPGLIIIDHVGLMRADRAHRDNKVVEEAETSNAIKALANELGIPVLALIQLRKGGAGGNSREPLDELKGSGAWSEDAGCVIRLEEARDQDELSGWQAQPKPVLIYAHIDKNRHGETGTAPLLFFREWSRFECYDPHAAHDPGHDWTH